jgi:hypothetical protein
MFDEITRMLNHLLWLGAHGLDIGAMTVFLYCFREREDLIDMLRGGVGRAHARGLLPPGRRLPRPAGARCRSTRPVQASATRSDRAAEREPAGLAARLHRGLHQALPGLRRRVRDAAHRQPHLEAAHGGHRRGLAGARAGAGLHRPDAARLRHRVGPAQEAALRGLRPAGLRHPGGRQRRLLRPLPGARRGDAPATASSSSASTGCAPTPAR